jgi:transcriptional regulator GlxA family with amidase domain
MNTKLNHVQDWLKLAKQANWSVSKLAKLCQVSTNTLRRHFLASMGKPPRFWLAEERQRQAVELLRAGSSSIKETATRMGYKQQTNFTRKFKEHWVFVLPSNHPFRRLTAVLVEND